MNNFSEIPNKQPIEANTLMTDCWEELGENFELNQFYRLYSCAEGWLGDGYLAIWTRQEIKKFREANRQVYSDKYHFFASDGGGTQFGFFTQNGQTFFVSAPDIGSKEDVHILGNWSQFLQLVKTRNYI